MNIEKNDGLRIQTFFPFAAFALFLGWGTTIRGTCESTVINTLKIEQQEIKHLMELVFSPCSEGVVFGGLESHWVRNLKETSILLYTVMEKKGLPVGLGVGALSGLSGGVICQ